jgi:hypothetical protein
MKFPGTRRGPRRRRVAMTIVVLNTDPVIRIPVQRMLDRAYRYDPDLARVSSDLAILGSIGPTGPLAPAPDGAALSASAGRFVGLWPATARLHTRVSAIRRPPGRTPFQEPPRAGADPPRPQRRMRLHRGGHGPILGIQPEQGHAAGQAGRSGQVRGRIRWPAPGDPPGQAHQVGRSGERHDQSQPWWPGVTMNVGTDSVGLIVISRHASLQAKES